MSPVFWSAFIVWMWAGFWWGQLAFNTSYTFKVRVYSFLTVLLLWPVIVPFINPLVRMGEKLQEKTKS
jgi:hypothetical protein